MHLAPILKTFAQNFDGEFYFDELHKNLYATDASVYRKKPLGVAYPQSEKGIQQLISLANSHGLGLIPRTAGTSLAGQCVGEGIVVDVSKYFTKIIHLDIDNSTVTVQPGVIRDELNLFLAPYHLFFGPNTSTSNRCMIGGMVGNNSSGTTSIQYGVTRDKVHSLKTILSNGESATFSSLNVKGVKEKAALDSLEGKIYSVLTEALSKKEVQEEIVKEFPKPTIHRRNTGYAVDALLNSEVFDPSSQHPLNLSKLLCGSEGTLAFTTEITLQVDPLPPPYAKMVAAQYNTLSACMKDVVIAMSHQLYTCELMDDVILGCTKKNKTYEPYRFFLKGDPKAILLLELRAHSSEDLDMKVNQLLESLKKSDQSDYRVVLSGEEIEMALELRKAGLGLLGNMVGDRKAVACIEDTAVSLNDLPAYIEEFSDLMDHYHQQAVYYAHAGAGELHLRPILDLKKESDVVLFRKITTDVAKLVKKYRGSFSGEHGDGIVRAEFLEMQIGKKNFDLLKKIKDTFDPNNIFNPGKITDAWPMDKSLRYETDRTEPQVETMLDFSDSEGILRLAEKCNGSGDCRKTEQSSGMLCPSYHATKNEKDTTRGRANVLREILTNNTKQNKFDSEELKEAFDLCIACKACHSECPSNVDMATAKAEFLYQYKKEHKSSRATHFFAKSSTYNRLGSQFPKVINTLFSTKWTSRFIKSYIGIDRRRSLPLLAPEPFHKYVENLPKPVSTDKKVWLFVDEFSNYLETSIAKDGYELLTTLGYEVGLITHLDSARALISKGFLEEARMEVDKNISYLKDKLSADRPLLGIEPSAILGFRDEYLRLASDKDTAVRLSKHCFLIEEFLSEEARKGNIDASRFTSEAKQIKIHVHCHQKSISNQKVTFDILNLPKNYTPTLIPSGCCGMAGSFGFEKEHYEVSMKIGGLKLFPAIIKASEEVIIVANGTSCRHQIKDGTKREACHPVTVLKNALLLPKD